MLTLGAFEAKTHFSSLLERVGRGEEVTITRHGKAVARLVPALAWDRAQASATVALMKELARGHTLGGLDWKELRDAGRR